MSAAVRPLGARGAAGIGHPRRNQAVEQIDRVQAKQHGLTDEELDFIIDYDVKYRMGQDEARRGNEPFQGRCGRNSEGEEHFPRPIRKWLACVRMG